MNYSLFVGSSEICIETCRNQAEKSTNPIPMAMEIDFLFQSVEDGANFTHIVALCVFGIHSIHSDFFSVLIFTRPSIFDFGTPWNEILKILLRSDPQAVNCALSSSSGYLLARKVKVPLQVFRLLLGFAVADSEDHFGSCWVFF